MAMKPDDMALANAMYDLYRAAVELHGVEDFTEMPCQHPCCAPGDWEGYQATRQALYDAIKRVEALAEAQLSQR